MNHVGLVGRIAKTPTLRKISDNRMHTNFTIAINRNYKNSQGVVEADFVSCSAWGKLAERIAQYCGKGSLVGVNGRLQTRSYTNRENVKVYTTEVLVDDVRFYVLKTHNRKGSQEQGTAGEENYVAESMEVFETEQDEKKLAHDSIEDQVIAADFELPDHKKSLQVT